MPKKISATPPLNLTVVSGTVANQADGKNPQSQQGASAARGQRGALGRANSPTAKDTQSYTNQADRKNTQSQQGKKQRGRKKTYINIDIPPYTPSYSQNTQSQQDVAQNHNHTGTDQIINQFITRTDDLASQNSIDITNIFSDFKKNINPNKLTGQHRIQLIETINKIAVNIESNQNIDFIALMTIFYSLSKTGILYNIGFKNNDCQQQQHLDASKNLINNLLKKIPQGINTQWDFANLFYSLGLLAKNSSISLDSLDINESIDNVLVLYNKYLKNNNYPKLDERYNSNIFWSLAYLVESSQIKLDSSKKIINYLFENIINNKYYFKAQTISNIFWAIAKLVEIPEYKQTIIDNQNSLNILFQSIDKTLNFIPQHISNILWAITKLIAILKCEQTIIDNQNSLNILLRNIDKDFDPTHKESSILSLSISKLVEIPKFKQTIINNQNSLNILLQSIHQILNFSPQDINNFLGSFTRLTAIPECKQTIINQNYLNILLQSIDKTFNPSREEVSNIFYYIANLVEIPEYKQDIIDNQNSLKLLFQKITQNNILNFNYKDISSLFMSIGKLVEIPECKQTIIDSQYYLNILLQRIANEEISFDLLDSIYCITFNVCKLFKHIKVNYQCVTTINLLFNKIFKTAVAHHTANSLPLPLPLPIEFRCHIIYKTIKLIEDNIITKNKPNEEDIRKLLLNDIIKNLEILDRNDLFLYMTIIIFYQAYLTKEEIIKISEYISSNIFSNPNPNLTEEKILSIYTFFFVRINDELEANQQNETLRNLENKFKNLIKDKLTELEKNTKNDKKPLITAMVISACVIKESDRYKEIDYTKERETEIEKITAEEAIKIVKAPHLFIKEYIKNNLPPFDFFYRDIIIEVNGPGHYADDKGDKPTGRTLIKYYLAKLAADFLLIINIVKLTGDRSQQIKELLTEPLKQADDRSISSADQNPPATLNPHAPAFNLLNPYALEFIPKN